MGRPGMGRPRPMALSYGSAMTYLVWIAVLIVNFVSGVVYCDDGESSTVASQPFRIGIIMVIVAILLLVAAVIVCRFACVNFCPSGGYKKVQDDDDDPPKEVIAETTVDSEPEELSSDCEVKQPLPESDPPDDDDTPEVTVVSPGGVVVPPRYSHVSSLPRYSQDEPGIPEEPEPDAGDISMTPLAENEAANDLTKKADVDKEDEPAVSADDVVAECHDEAHSPLNNEDRAPAEEEERSSGDEVNNSSNGSPPPPYEDFRSRDSSEDRLGDLEDQGATASPPAEEAEDALDTSSDSDNVLLAAANAPTLERPHILNIDEPDGKLPPHPEHVTPSVADQEDFDEVDGHDDDEDAAPSPTVPLDPVVHIESPGGPDESFDDDMAPIPASLLAANSDKSSLRGLP